MVFLTVESSFGIDLASSGVRSRCTWWVISAKACKAYGSFFNASPANADRQGSLPRQRSGAGGYGHVARCAAGFHQNEHEAGGVCIDFALVRKKTEPENHLVGLPPIIRKPWSVRSQ